MFPVSYRLPGAQRDLVAGKRVVIVNDVIGAGSAVLGTLKDLYECGADPVAIGALATRGPAAIGAGAGEWSGAGDPRLVSRRDVEAVGVSDVRGGCSAVR